MKDICCDITPISGSSSGYRKKRSHNRFTLGLKEHCSEAHLTPLI